MASVAEFAALIRKKTGAYDDIEDDELTRLVLSKYPEYGDMVDTTTPPPAPAPKPESKPAPTGYQGARYDLAAVKDQPGPAFDFLSKPPAEGVQAPPSTPDVSGVVEPPEVAEIPEGTPEPITFQDVESQVSRETLRRKELGAKPGETAAQARRRAEAEKKAKAKGLEITGGLGTYLETPERLAEKETGIRRPQLVPGQNTVMDIYRTMTQPLQVLAAGMRGKSYEQSLGERYLAAEETLKNADELEKLKKKKDSGEALTAEETAKLDAEPHFWESLGSAVKSILNDPAAFGLELATEITEYLPLMAGGVGGVRAGIKGAEKAVQAGKIAARSSKLAKFEGRLGREAETLLKGGREAEAAKRAADTKSILERLKSRWETREALETTKKSLTGPSKTEVIGREAAEEVGGNLAVGVPIEQQRGREYGVSAAVQDATLGLLFMLPGMAKLRRGENITPQEFEQIGRVVRRAGLEKHPQIQQLLPVFQELSKNTQFEGLFDVSAEKRVISRHDAEKAYGREYVEKTFPGVEEFEVAGQAGIKPVSRERVRAGGVRQGEARLYQKAEAADVVEEAAHLAEARIRKEAPELAAKLEAWKAEAKTKTGADPLPSDLELFSQAFAARTYPESYTAAVRGLEIPEELYDEFNAYVGIGGAKRQISKPDVTGLKETAPEAKPLEQPEIPPVTEMRPPKRHAFVQSIIDNEAATISKKYGLEAGNRDAVLDAEERLLDDRGIGLLNNKAYQRDIKDPSIGKSHVAFDIGNFKEFNDKYGHIEGGDKILKEFGEILGRLTDEAGGRAYSPHGDEFTGIYADDDVAQKIAELAAREAAGKRIEFFDAQGNSVGVSDGFIVDWGHGQTPTLADAAQVRNKELAKQSRQVYRRNAESPADRRGAGDVLRTDEGTGRGPDGSPEVRHEGEPGRTPGVLAEPQEPGPRLSEDAPPPGWMPKLTATGNRGTFDPESPNIAYSLKPSMVERKVQALRASESAYGAERSELLRDTEETWASLEKETREIAESHTVEQFTDIANKRQLTPSEVMAVGARIKNAEVMEIDAIAEGAAARASGDKTAAAVADAKVAAAQVEKLALLQAGINNGTESARALAVHRKLMDAIAHNADTVFLLKAIRELGVKDAEALKLLRIFKDDPLNFGAAVHSYLKFGAVDKVLEYWKAGLLSGVPTHVANTVGNTVEAAIQNAETYLSGGVDKFLHGAFGGRRARFASEGVLESAGLLSGFAPAAGKFLANLQPIFTLKGKEFNLQNKFDRQSGAIAGKKGEFVRIPFKLLELEDDFFKVVSKYGDLYKQAHRKARKEGLQGDALRKREADIVAEFWNSPDKHRDIAQEVAKGGRSRTYQNIYGEEGKKYAPFAALAAGLQMGLKGSKSAPVRLLSNIVFPFSKTPANIFDRAVERSPIGFAYTAGMMKDFVKAEKEAATKQRIADQNPGNLGYQKAAAAARDAADRLRGQVSDQMARATVGTVALSGIALLASQGFVTGSGPKEPDKRKLLEKELGWQPYAVKISGKYIPLQRIMGAMAPGIGAVADMVEASLNGDEAGAKLGSALIKNLTDQSYLQGLIEFSSAVGDPKRYAKTYGMNMMTSIVPMSSLVRSLARGADRTERDVKGEGFTDELKNRLMANIPYLSRKLPEKYGATGKVQVRKGTTLERILSPAPISEEKADSVVEKELLSLSYKVPPLERKLRTNLSSDMKADDYRLEDAEFQVLLKARREAVEELRGEIESEEWAKMDVDERSKTARDIFQGILDGAREEVKDMIRTRMGI